MRRAIAKILLTVALVGMFVAGCGKEEKKETLIDIEVERAEDLLVKAWASYDEKEKFNVVGGNVENMAFGFPCEFALDATEELEYTLCVPAEGVELLDNAASIIDEMDPFTFTSGAFDLKDAKDVNKLTNMIKDTLLSREWSEESKPDKYIVAKANEKYVILIYGEKEKVNTFKDKLVFQTKAKVLYEETIK